MAVTVWQACFPMDLAGIRARHNEFAAASTIACCLLCKPKSRARALVNKINGVRIDKLEDVIRAFEEHTTREQHLIDFLPDQAIEAIDKAGAAQAHSEILKTYGVPKDRRL